VRIIRELQALNQIELAKYFPISQTTFAGTVGSVYSYEVWSDG